MSILFLKKTQKIIPKTVANFGLEWYNKKERQKQREEMHMKRLTLRLCSLLVAAALLIAFTGCTPAEENTGAGYMFTAVLPGDPDCLDPQFTENENAEIVLRNIMEGLMRPDSTGKPVPAGASEYTVSEDGLSYMFTLRENSYWFNKDMDSDRPERVTSRDYVFAFRRLVDPSMRSPYGREFACIKNAGAIMAGEDSPQHLGVTAPDGNTVIFELEYPNPDFLTLLCRTCAVPCNEEFFTAAEGRYGLDDSTLLCNGPFYLTKWNYDQYSTGNFLTFRKCSLYHDPDAVFPVSLQFNIMHTREDAEADFLDGGEDVIITDRCYPKYLHDAKFSVQTSQCTTMGLIFNPDDENMKNASLRKALSYSIDRTKLAEELSEDAVPAYGIVPPATTLLGSSYRSIQADEPLADPYDPKAASDLFARANAELDLGAAGSIRILVPSTMTDTDALLAMCQEWQDLFGYYIGIETVTPDELDDRIADGNYSIALYSLTPAHDGCLSAMETFSDHAALFGFRSGDFTKLLDGLSRPTDLSATAALCADMEHIILQTQTFIPLFYKTTYLITTADNVDIRFDPFTRTADFKEAKHFE